MGIEHTFLIMPQLKGPGLPVQSLSELYLRFRKECRLPTSRVDGKPTRLI